jgi:hypothetical protein
VDHSAEEAAAEDTDETLLQMDSGQRIANSSSGRNEHAGSVIQKMSISITRMRNVFSASFPNKGKLSRGVSLVRAHVINASLLPQLNARDI